MRTIELSIIKLAINDHDALTYAKENLNDAMFPSMDLRQVWQFMDEETTEESLYIWMDKWDKAGIIKAELSITPSQQIDFYVGELSEEHTRITLLDIAAEINQNILNINIGQVIERLETELPTANKSITMVTAVKRSFNEVTRRFKKTIRNFYRTKWKEFDSIIALDTRKLILIAAEKKIGKTRFMAALIRQILTHNKQVKVQWWTLEMSAQELVRCFVSAITKLPEGVLLSKLRRMTDDELKAVEKAHKLIESLPIEFIDEPTNVWEMKRKMVKFKKMLSAKTDAMYVVDNIGFITPHTADDNRLDRDFAVIFKDVRDKTNGTVLLLHHLTKAAGQIDKIELGYEPHLTNIRGSGRLLDFVNQVWMLHRPNFYKDLMRHYAKVFDEETYEKLNQLFLVICALNRDGDTGDVRLKHDIGICKFENFK